MEKVLTYTKNLDFAGFESDELVKDAVLLNLQIVGEAANHISEEIQKRYPRIPWRDMANFRIIVVHIYFSVDMAKVWELITTHLPTNLADLKLVLSELEK